MERPREKAQARRMGWLAVWRQGLGQDGGLGRCRAGRAEALEVGGGGGEKGCGMAGLIECRDARPKDGIWRGVGGEVYPL